MEIIFCHGLETGPHGRKYHAMREAGLEVVAPDFQGMPLAARVSKLIPILEASTAPVIVGSSYGGITAVCAAIHVVEAGARITGMVLCAPALARAEPPADSMDLYAPAPTLIVHGTRDDVCPIEVSRTFAAANANTTLVEVDDEHALPDSIDVIIEATRSFIDDRAFTPATR